MERIILASQSPRRKQLLEWAEIPFEVQVQPTDESFPPGMEIDQIPIHIARNKILALDLSPNHPSVILAADTIVVIDGQILGKPLNRPHAMEMLSLLAGNMHEVITGVVLKKGNLEYGFSDRTRVWFYPLSQKQIEFYVDKYQPFDKAGAYAIQEWIGVVGIQRIEGDFYNVMGLPISRVSQAIGKLAN